MHAMPLELQFHGTFVIYGIYDPVFNHKVAEKVHFEIRYPEQSLSLHLTGLFNLYDL